MNTENPDHNDNGTNIEQIIARFELLENSYQHLNAQIHRNLYLSLIVLVGIIGSFGTNQQAVILLSASFVGGLAFAGLAVWTYLYADARNKVKKEKADIYDARNDIDYFKYTQPISDPGDLSSSWKIGILFLYYAIFTIGLVILAIYLGSRVW